MSQDRVYQIWKKYFLKDLRRCLTRAKQINITTQSEFNEVTRNPEKLAFYVDGIIKVI